MIQALVCVEVWCCPIAASSPGLTVVQSWICVNDSFLQVWQVSGCFLCQLVVDLLSVSVQVLVMELRFVDRCVQLSLESRFWLVALQVDWVESVDWASTFVVKVLLLHQWSCPECPIQVTGKVVVQVL